MTLLILINFKNNAKSSRPSLYYYNALSVALHRTPTNRNSAKIDPNLILAQFDTNEDGTLYEPSTGNNFRILVSNKIAMFHFLVLYGKSVIPFQAGQISIQDGKSCQVLLRMRLWRIRRTMMLGTAINQLSE